MTKQNDTQVCEHLKAIVFDWAGTMIDHGSRAPAMVFRELFLRRGIEITIGQAREPMGMAKREHIAAIGAMEPIAAQWLEKFGQPMGEAEIDSMYQEFLPMQKSTLKEHCNLIPGAADAARACRDMGLRIGSSTGYTRELMEVVSAAAAEQGYTPDCVLCAEDAPLGRPAPFLLFEAAKRLNAYPMWTFVKVDDTTVGIEAGRNAGCWTIGVTKTGNELGLSEAEIDALSEQERDQKCAAAGAKLTNAGAHYLVESVAEIPALLPEIDQRLESGERPV